MKQLPKADVIQMAVDFGIFGPARSRKQAIQMIERRIANRKESWQRTRFGGEYSK